MGRQSECIQIACDRDRCNAKDLRYSTISVSLKKALLKQDEEKRKDLLTRFRSISDTVGILQHVASLIINYALCLNPQLTNDVKNMKTIFDQGHHRS